MEALILVATLGGPTMFARIGVMRALNRHVERVFDPSRKDKHWGWRKLKRDQSMMEAGKQKTAERPGSFVSVDRQGL
jgi:hypothetical protein